MAPESIDDLSKLEPREFTYTLLNNIFWKHRGKGEGSLTIGAAVVHKELAVYHSNSGKKHDFSVTYWYVTPEGERVEFSKESRFSSNRRSDPERNWGLPE